MSRATRIGTGMRRKDLHLVEGIGGLHARLELVIRSLSSAEVGRRTGTHPESVRRYRSGQMPSLAFIAAFCRAMGVSADWLLNGRGERFVRGQGEAGEGLAAALDELAQQVRAEGGGEEPLARWPRLVSADDTELPAWRGSQGAGGWVTG